MGLAAAWQKIMVHPKYRLSCFSAAAFVVVFAALSAPIDGVHIVHAGAGIEPGRCGAGGPVRVVAFGDSLTAGLGLSASAAFPAQLAKALKSSGHNIVIANAGVSGDTTSGGLARFDWAVPPETDAVILELGANDALRGVSPQIARENLDKIIARLKMRKIAVLLTGMIALRNWGGDFEAAFNPIFPELAAKHGTLFYPFFLEGVALEPRLNQSDGLHPNSKGVAEIVSRILPKVEALLVRAKALCVSGAKASPARE